MLEPYIPIILILLSATVFGVVSANLSWLLGPRKPYREKMSTYESGMEPVRSARERFSVKFYMVALSFIIFDIEVVFMYPWAVQYRDLFAEHGFYAFIGMFVFLVILLIGYVYELKKGALRWD